MTLVQRLLVWATMLLCAGSALAESGLCVVAGDCAALLDADGTEIIMPGVYADIFCLVDGERYAVGADTDAGRRYGLCDGSGALLTEIAYEMLAEMDGTILYRQDGLYGAMDMEGNVLLDAAYTQLVCGENGCFLALTTDPNDDSADLIWLVDPAEEEPLSTGVRTDTGLQRLSENRMPFRSPDTERYGCLNGAGEVALPESFDYVGEFENGAARASVDGKFGVIDTNGAWRIPADYGFLERGDGIFVGLIGRECCVVFGTESFEERLRLEGVNLRAAAVGSYTVVVDDTGMRIYSADGQLLLEADGSATVSPGAGDQLILSDGDWGAKCVSVVSADGALSERRDQHLLPLDGDRYAFMTMNVAAYYSEALGSIRYSCDYESIRFGMMNAAGEEILPAEFSEIRRLAEGRYLTVTADGLRVVDADGSTLWSLLSDEGD